MSHFPSKHGARVAFDPIRSAPPPPRRSAVVPAPSKIARPVVAEPAPKPRSPSYAEVDVVEANLSGDPRYDGE